jgi:predicted RNase H-like HicB family nuclease
MLESVVMTREFTAIIKKKGRRYVACVEEIPGVNTQGKTLREARLNLREALHLILEEKRRVVAKNRCPAHAVRLKTKRGINQEKHDYVRP